MSVGHQESTRDGTSQRTERQRGRHLGVRLPEPENSIVLVCELCVLRPLPNCVRSMLPRMGVSPFHRPFPHVINRLVSLARVPGSLGKSSAEEHRHNKPRDFCIHRETLTPPCVLGHVCVAT